MYEKETYDVILDRMLGRVSDKLDKRPSSSYLRYSTAPRRWNCRHFILSWSI